MPLYPLSIARCQHLKVNGIQCGSPSIRDAKFCFYHMRYHWPELEKIEDKSSWHLGFPTLEDANSIQVSLAKIMEQLVCNELDLKTAALLLYALQTASINLKRTSLEPQLPTQVVIDRDAVAHRPIGTSAWSRVEGREYDDLSPDDPSKDNRSKDDRSKNDRIQNTDAAKSPQPKKLDRESIVAAIRPS